MYWWQKGQHSCLTLVAIPLMISTLRLPYLSNFCLSFMIIFWFPANATSIIKHSCLSFLKVTQSSCQCFNTFSVWKSKHPEYFCLPLSVSYLFWYMLVLRTCYLISTFLAWCPGKVLRYLVMSVLALFQHKTFRNTNNILFFQTSSKPFNRGLFAVVWYKSLFTGIGI